LARALSDSFDLIAGTSAGGIVALALGAGLAPSEIVTHYKSLVRTVSRPHGGVGGADHAN
jgi:patatin-like phospholipase/acyl hydrolase